MMATSTRLAAMASLRSCSAKVRRPSLSWSILSPSIEPEVSRSRRQAQRGSGLSANSMLLNGTCSRSDIEPLPPDRWLILTIRDGPQTGGRHAFPDGDELRVPRLVGEEHGARLGFGHAPQP